MTLTKPRSMIIESECYYQLHKVARFLDISSETLRREIEKGSIEAFKIGESIYTIKGSEIQRYLDTRKVKHSMKISAAR